MTRNRQHGHHLVLRAEPHGGDAPGACWRASRRRRRQLRRPLSQSADCRHLPPDAIPADATHATSSPPTCHQPPLSSTRFTLSPHRPYDAECLLSLYIYLIHTSTPDRLYALYFSFIPMRCPDLGEPALRTHTGARVVRYLGSLICVCVCV